MIGKLNKSKITQNNKKIASIKIKKIYLHKLKVAIKKNKQKTKMNIRKLIKITKTVSGEAKKDWLKTINFSIQILQC